MRHSRVQKTRASVSLLGPVETAKAIAKAASSKIFSYYPERDNRFDKRFKTDTSAIVEEEDLGITDQTARQNAVFYVSLPTQFVLHVLRSLDLDYSNFDFVDFGCGKGRILMLASHLPFRSIKGIEISEELCRIAQNNLERYRPKAQACTQISVECKNAIDFDISPDDTVYHFYHPFQEDVLKPVLNNIAAAFHGSGKRVYVIYVWMHLPTLFPLFEELGFAQLRHVQTLNQRYQYALYTLQSARTEGINPTDQIEDAAS